MTKLVLGIGAAVGCLALAAPAQAEGNAPAGERFGNAGVLNLGTDLGFLISSTSYKAAQGDDPDSVTQFLIQPAADYFVVDNVSVGVLVGFGQSESGSGGDSVKLSTTSFGARAGYHVPIGESFGLWPRLGLRLASSTSEVSNTQGTTTTTHKSESSRTTIGLDVPFLIHPAEHFHLGIGPFLEKDLSAKVKPDGGQEADTDKETTIGLRLEIAGWFLL